MVRAGEGLELAARPEIVGIPTVREPDGLAMSSRNVFLTAEERARAIAIHRAMQAAAAERSPPDAERIMAAIITKAGLVIQYAVVRDAETLLTPNPLRPCRMLVAAKLGSVRLIDNASWP
jgi:pantoate--beta-alanine ligase